jgi:hypothetical protein
MGTHGPLDPRYQDKLVAMARTLEELLNEGARGNDRKIGFCILMFPFGEVPDGRINYVSNGARREDMIGAFRELADRFEGTHPEEQA